MATSEESIEPPPPCQEAGRRPSAGWTRGRARLDRHLVPMKPDRPARVAPRRMPTLGLCRRVRQGHSSRSDL